MFPIKDRKKAKEENSQSKIERKQKKKIPNQRLRESKKERKFPIKDWKKTKKRKFLIKDWKKTKKKGKFPIKDRKKAKRNIQKGLWTRQYLNNTELSHVNKKRKETMTQSGPLPLKRKRPKHSKPNFPQKKTPFPRKSSIDP